MAVAQELTQNSWILETKTGDKLGILSSNPETGKYTIISEDTEVSFDTFEELEIAINERVTVKQREYAAATFKDLEGYPIIHEAPVDVITTDGIISYRNGEKRKKRFYAGYWVISDRRTTMWYAKVSLSEEVYDSMVGDGVTPIGPFKDKVEALFIAKQTTSASEADNK